MTSISRANPAASRRTDVSWNAAFSLVLAVSATGVSAQSVQFEHELRTLIGYYAIPVSHTRDALRERFERLTDRWRRETRWLSSTNEISMHPAYQEIIGMGPVALPWILHELRANSGHWFWALKAISGHDPVPPKDRGDISRMKEAWLVWGRARGLLAS